MKNQSSNNLITRNPYVLDIETYFDKDFSLTKLTTESYCRAPQFEFLLMAVVTPTGEKFWIPGPEIGKWLKTIDWSQQAVLCHHAHFDLLALNHHFGFKPAKIYCSLSMARAVLGVHVSVGLDSLSRHFGLAAKNVPYELFRGKRFSELVRYGALLRTIGAGAVHDAELCRDIFNRLLPHFPAGELDLIDLTVRMFTEPALEADLHELADIWVSENKRRRGDLDKLGVTENQLQSSTLLIDLLEAAGVEVEYKPGKAGPIPCFAKTDHFMEELLEHPSPYVQALATRRLGLRSTIDQTRAERLGDMATRGRLPVYLKYAGAHTLRWSGGDRVNWQNFRRGGRIRKTILAPDGCSLVVADAKQIECRLLNCWAGQTDIVETFRRGEDPYIRNAQLVYGNRPVTPAERGTGKQLELSCGYGAGAATIQKTARLGIYGPPVLITLDEAKRWRDIYRQTHPYVVNLWKEADSILARLNKVESFDWRGLKILCGDSHKRIGLPNELYLIYDTLAWDQNEWRIRTRRGGSVKMYGAKLIENIIQYMARIYIAQTMLWIRKAGIKIALMTHDEIVAVVPAGKAELAREFMVKAFARVPDWMPDLPLDVETMISQRYEK